LPGDIANSEEALQIDNATNIDEEEIERDQEVELEFM
jgi:hypothetical protein